jgi:EAL domain-containing protein (putative c-di-GMP-specific phosphodiesterase class I)
MNDIAGFIPVGCKECRNKTNLGIDFTMAFQPIVDISSKSIFGYEALVRGINNEGAFSVLSQLTDSNRYRFDQTIRVKAIDLAKSLNLQGMLSINFLPNAVYKPETCIRATLEAAAEMEFPTNQLMFEVSEAEKVIDINHLREIFKEYKKHNFTTAIDDFGAGYAGLNLLADLEPDIVKLDMAMTRNIHTDRVRQSLVYAIISACKDLGITIIAEGIESVDECNALAQQGVTLFQGYHFAKPGFEFLPTIHDSAWANIRQRVN